MAEITFLFRGRKPDIDAVILQLEGLPDVRSVSSKEAPKVNSIVTQRKQHQFEVYDAIVSIILSLASSAAYDGIKSAVAALAKKREVHVEEKPKNGGDDR